MKVSVILGLIVLLACSCESTPQDTTLTAGLLALSGEILEATTQLESIAYSHPNDPYSDSYESLAHEYHSLSHLISASCNNLVTLTLIYYECECNSEEAHRMYIDQWRDTASLFEPQIEAAFELLHVMKEFEVADDVYKASFDLSNLYIKAKNAIEKRAKELEKSDSPSL